MLQDLQENTDLYWKHKSLKHPHYPQGIVLQILQVMFYQFPFFPVKKKCCTSPLQALL